MSNVTKKDTTTAVAANVPDEAWGTEGTNSRDILIPKLLLMQKTSALVDADKAKLGDLVDSVSGKVLGNKDKPVMVIPILSSSTWEIMDLREAKPRYFGNIPRTPSNEDLDWKGTATDPKTGMEFPIKRIKAFNCFVLLAEEAEKPGAMPYALSFRSTSLKEGKKLATHFNISAGLRKPPARTMFRISSTKTTNDGVTWAVFHVEEAAPTSPTALEKAYQWYKTISQGLAKVDNDAETRLGADETPVAPTATKTTERRAEF